MKRMIMKGKVLLKLTGVLIGFLIATSLKAEGTRELLVNNTLTYDSSKRQPGEFFGIQFWDQSDTRRKSGTYQSITTDPSQNSAQADAIYRIKIKICNVGEVINLGFNQPGNDIFWRLYKPDGTTVEFNDNTIAANGDAGPALTQQGTAGNPFSYRLPGLYTITNATNANPIVITTSQQHGFASNHVVNINSIVGNTAANGTFRITVLTATTFSLQTLGGVNVAGNGAYTSGGRVSGFGFVRTYKEGAVGPQGGEVYTGLPAAYTGAAGYRPLQHIADQVGTYYIAFNPTHADNNVISKRIFSIFDISVWNTIGSRTFQPGRLHCAAWDINCGSTADPTSQFNAKLFFYSKDSVITAVSFNQMRPYGFVVTANSRGVANTGNDNNDRKSTILFNGFPEYPIFLNSPIKTGAGAYQVCGFEPKASFGQVLDASISGCDDDRCINILADKTATVGINILPDTTRTTITNATNASPIVITTASPHGLQSTNIVTITGVNGNTAANGTFSVVVLSANQFQLKNQTTLTNVAGNGAYTSGGKASSSQFTPRILDDQVITANVNTCIPWDGKDGAGNKIIGPIKVTINYYNGLTNLPLFDVEEHRFGYKIDLIAPTAAPGSKPILVYWDDRPVNNIPPLNIKDFTAGRALDGYYDLPSPGQIAANNVGNFGNGVAHSTYNLYGCDPSVDNNTTLAGTQGCHLWGARGLNGATATQNTFETHNTWWNANVIERVINYVPSNIEVYAMRSHAPLPLGSAPYAGTPNDTTVCSNVNGVLLNPVVRRENPVGSGTYVAHTGRWTVVNGTGTFLSTGTTTSSTLNDTYVLSASERTSGGSVTLRIVSDSTTLTPCGTANDTMRINIIIGPDVAGGNDTSVCKSNPLVNLNGTVGGSTSTFQWFPDATGTGGIFVPSPQSEDPTYEAPASVTGAPGTTTVTMKIKSLTNTGSIACPADSDEVVITYFANPIVAVPDPAAICSTTGSVALNATINGGTTATDFTISWAGNGTFSDGTILNPTYTPTATEIANGTAKVVIRVTQNLPASCGMVTDTATITIVAPPSVGAGLDGLFCSNRTDTIALAGTVSGSFTTTTWSCTNCSGGTFNNASALTTFYDPTAADLAQTSLNFVLTASSTSCGSITDDVTVNITQIPASLTISGNDACPSNPCADFAAPLAGGIWSSPSGNPFTPSSNSQNVNYCMSAAEVSATFTILTYTIPADGNCLAVSGTAIFALSDGDRPFAGNDSSLCENNAVIALTSATGNVSPTGSISWQSLSASPGSFDNASTLNPTYSLSPTEITNGGATLVVTITENLCTPQSDTIILSVYDAPTVSAGPDRDVCVNNSTVTLNGFISAGTPQWSYVSGVNGTFSAANAVNTDFTTSSTPTAGQTTVLRLTSSLAGCSNVPATMTITYTPSPVIDITTVSPVTVCKSNPNHDIAATIANAGGITWVSTGTGVFSPKADSINATYIPSAADLTAGTVTITATSTFNGNCNAVNSTESIVINYSDAPTVTAADRSICENVTTGVAISGTFSAAVTGQAWTSGSGCVSCFADPTALSTTYTPSAQDIANGSVVLTLASTGGPNGCLPVQGQMTITIDRAPTVFAGADLVVCTNQNSVSLTPSSTNATTFGWTVVEGSGSVAPANSANATYSITAQDKEDGTVILRLSADDAASCAAVTDELVINFTDFPTLSAGPDRTVCSNDLPIQLDGSGAAGTWSTGTAGTFNPNTTTANATFQPTSTAPAAITFTYAIAASGGCPAVSDQVIITLITGPDAVANDSYAMCSGTGTGTVDFITVTANPSTGAGFWSTAGTGSFANINGVPTTTYTPSAADIAAGSVVLTFETTGNGVCSADIETATLTFTDIVLSAGPDHNECGSTAGSTFDVTGSVLINGAAGAFTWSVQTGSGSITPTGTYTLGAGDIPVAPATTTVVLRVSATSGACNITDDATITLLPAPVVTASTAAPNFCETASAIPVSGTITGDVTSGRWRSSNGGGSFFPNDVFNAAQTTVDYVPVAADAALGTITFILEADSALCGTGVINSVTVTLDNNPVVNAGPDDTLCFNNNVYTLAGTITNSTSGGSWSASSGCVACFTTGTAVATATTYDADDLTDINNGFVTLTLTAAANGTCPGDSDKVVITFTEGPTVSAGLDRTICGNNRTLNIVGTVNAPFTGEWSKTGGLTTGFGNAADPSTTYTALDADTMSGTVDLIFTSVDPAGLCAPDDDTITVTITDAPTVSFASSTITACSDTFFVVLDANTNLSANPSGLWSGGSGSFINANAASDTAFYVPSITERNNANANGTEVITLTYITSSGFCLPDTGTVDVTLTAAPTVTITNTPVDSTELCANQTTLNLGATFTSAGGVIWTTTGTGTFDNNISATPIYTFSPLDSAAGTIVITATSTGNGSCFSAREQYKVKLQPLPIANAGEDVTICQDVASVDLSDASVTDATGGVWTTSGTGVFGATTSDVTGTYFPSACCFATLDTAQASVTLTLTTTGNGLCPADVDTRVITFIKLPVVSAGVTDDTICADNLSYTLNADTLRASGFTWSSPDGGSFSPTNTLLNSVYAPTGVGTFRLVATASGLGSCGIVRDTVLITVRDVPNVTLSLDANICAVGENATQDFTVSGMTLTNATGVNWVSSSGGTFDLTDPLVPVYTISAADIANESVIITATTNAGIGTCNADADQMTIFIKKAPTADAGPDITICENATTVNLNGLISNSDAGTWSSDSLTVMFDDPNNLNATYTFNNGIAGKIIPVVLSALGQGACGPATDTLLITYTTTPTLSVGNNQSECFVSNADILTFQLSSAGVAGTWTTNASDPAPIFTPNASTPNAIYTPSALALTNGNVVTLTFTAANAGCFAGTETDVMTVTLNETPELTTANTADICETSPTAALNTVLAQGVSGIQWTLVQGFGSLTNANTANATYNVNANDKNLDSIVVLVTTTSATCPADQDTVSFLVDANPVVFAGADQIVCADKLNVAGAIQLNGTASNTPSITWSSGNGSAVTANSLTSTFTVTSFPATVTLTPAANGACPGAPDNVIISSTTTPVVALLASKDTCARMAPINLSSAFDVGGNVTPTGTFTTGLWSKVPGNASGSFVPNANTLHGQFVPNAADLSRGFVDLVLTATNTGVCTNVYDDTVRFNFDVQPTVNAGADLTFCAQNKFITVNGSSTGAADGITWSTAGTGTFNTATSLPTVYEVSSLDSLNGGTILSVTTTNGATISCPDVTDFVSLILTPAPLTIVNAGFDQQLCIDNTSAQLTGFILNATGGIWRIVQGSGQLSDSTDLNATYVFSAADKSEDTLMLALVSVGHDALCLPTADTVLVIFTPTPTITPAANDEVCASSPLIQLGTSISAPSTNQGKWTSNGDGVFSPNEFTIGAQYTPGPGDIANGFVGFVLTSTSNGTCIGSYSADTSTVITPFIEASVSSSDIMCANANGHVLNATSTTGTGIWKIVTDDGSVNATNVAGTSALFVPGATDIVNQAASVRFVTTGSVCAPDSVQVQLAINPAPVVTVSPDQTVCADVISGGFNISGDVTVASGATWSTLGSGSFINITTGGGATKTVSATYVPSAADTTAGSVQLILTSTGNLSSGGALCDAEDDTITITIMPEPTVNANANGVCVSTTGITLNGTVTQDPVFYPSAFGGWTSTGSGVFALDEFDGNVTYTPTPADITAGNVTITWSSLGAGTCASNSRSIKLNTAPLPLADAGSDQFTCNSAFVNLNATPYEGGTYEWALVGSAPGTSGTGLSVSVNTVGSYELTLTDRFGCTNTDTVVVNLVNTPAGLSIPPQACYDYYLYLQIAPQPTTLDPRGDFQWSYEGLVMSGENLDSVRVHSPGDYAVVYTLGACVQTFGTTTVNDVPRVKTPDYTGCANATVSATVELINNTIAPYTFTWHTSTPPAGLVTTTNDENTPAVLPVSPVNASGFDTLTYYIRVTDNNACFKDDSLWIFSIPRPRPDMPDSIMQCEGVLVSIDGSLTPPGNVDSLRAFNPVFRWYEASDAATTIDNDTIWATNSLSGNFVFEVTVDQCTGDDTTKIIFLPYPTKTLANDLTQCFERAPTAVLDAGDGGADVTGSPYLTDLNYDWSGDGTGVADTVRTFTVEEAFFKTFDTEDITYIVNIEAVYSTLSCAADDTIEVHDVCAPRLFPPTAFHPGDPNSEDGFFTIKGKYFTNFKLNVFNRWGEIIFSSTDVNDTWDGTYRGELMPVGVYAYTITYEGKSDEYTGPFAKEGRIVLIR